MAAVPASPTPFVDWTLLGQIALISLCAGVGLVVAFSIGLSALSRARSAESSPSARSARWAIAVVMASVIVAALLWGLYLIVKKS